MIESVEMLSFSSEPIDGGVGNSKSPMGVEPAGRHWLVVLASCGFNVPQTVVAGSRLPATYI